MSLTSAGTCHTSWHHAVTCTAASDRPPCGSDASQMLKYTTLLDAAPCVAFPAHTEGAFISHGLLSATPSHINIASSRV